MRASDISFYFFPFNPDKKFLVNFLIHFIEMFNCCRIPGCIDPFLPNLPILYPLKTPENL